MPIPVKSDESGLPASGFHAIFQPLEQLMGRLDRFLDDQVEAFEPEIQELVRYTLESSGKRIRPILLFYSGWREDGDLEDAFIQAAAVIELVHLATLVHDDILDDALLRHKRETISQKYGSSVAVLFGDALFAHALKLAAEFPTVEVCRTVSLATRRVCAGEIQQTFSRNSPDLSLERYFRIIELKTAELFWLSCRLGGMLAGRERPFVEAVELYGRHLGTAYQVFDDMADLFGEEAKIGKTLGTDLANGKFTLPLLLLFQAMKAADRDALIHNLKTGDDSVFQELRERLQEYRIQERVMTIFEKEVARANAAMMPFATVVGVDKLLMINDFVVGQIRALTSAQTAVQAS